MIRYLARLMDIRMNNNTVPGDWKKAIVVPIYKSFGGWKLQTGQSKLGGW